MAKSNDKRVYDIRASAGLGGQECVLAISADSTLLDLHLALLGAFDWRGNYGEQERGAYRIDFATKVYTEGRGSRTALRRLLRVDAAFVCTALEPKLVLECVVLREYEVRSRRHHPKVLDAGGTEHDAKTATWSAQAGMRREFRDDHDDERSLEFIQGMLVAIVSGPVILPSQWLGEIVQANQYATIEEAKRAYEGIMRLHNDIASALRTTPEMFVANTTRMLSADDGTRLVDWNRGYVYGMALGGDEWILAMRDPEMHSLFEPIAAGMELASSAEKRTWLLDTKLRGDLARTHGMAAVGIAELWRRRLFPQVETVRRSGPKVSPNAPCPCGSGKKYKRCCSPLRVVES